MKSSSTESDSPESIKAVDTFTSSPEFRNDFRSDGDIHKKSQQVSSSSPRRFFSGKKTHGNKLSAKKRTLSFEERPLFLKDDKLIQIQDRSSRSISFNYNNNNDVNEKNIAGALSKSPLIVIESRANSEAPDNRFLNTPDSHLNFSRLAYNLPKFNEEFEAIKKTPRKPSDVAQHVGNQAMKTFKPNCSGKSLKRKTQSLLPFTKWLFNYDARKNLIADIIAGLTIVVFQVPQSMGYSLIAKVPPVYGLYSSFFPPLLYTLTGTSRHCAVAKLLESTSKIQYFLIGSFAVISLMTGSLVVQVLHERGLTLDNYGSFPPIHIAIAVAFLIGIYQLVFGILRLGFISVYMSEQLVSGFTTAASFYVFTSQFPYLLGLSLPYHAGPLALVNSYIDLAKHIEKTHYITLAISVCCILTLLFFKLYVNEVIKKKTKINIPFPIELVIVIVTTVLSHFFEWEKNWKVKVVGEIPRGLPMPQPPDWTLVKDIAVRCIPLAIIAYSITISVGKIFAAKHGYKINPNQELLSLGVTNIFSSFFKCMPSAASLSRSAVQESAGGRTQVVSLINCAGILLVLFYIGSLLEKLPYCVLASIIAVALKTLLGQIKDFCKYWSVNKVDSSIWLITFFAVLLLDVDLGLYVGLGYSLLTLIYKSQRPKMYLLGPVAESDVYVPVKKYISATEIPGIKIYQFCGPLHFANIQYFKTGLIKKTGVSVSDYIHQKEKLEKKERKAAKIANQCNGHLKNQNVIQSIRHASVGSDDLSMIKLPTHIIIDCSMFSYIDTTGVRQLKSTVQEYESIGITTFLAGVATHVDRMLYKDDFYRDVPPHHVYITLHDAVHHALDNIRNISNSPVNVPIEDILSERSDSISCTTEASSNAFLSRDDLDEGYDPSLDPSELKPVDLSETVINK